MALYALPENFANLDRPYIHEAEAMLRESAYPQKNNVYCRSVLKHEDDVCSAHFSPDGKFVVTASGDHTARIWDAQTSKPVTEPMKHESLVNSAVFSPDGKFVVTASLDSTACVWDAQSGKPVTESLRHESSVESALFSPDGKYVVTASHDHTARIWPFTPLQELIDKYRKDPEHDWSLTEDEKEEYSLE